MRVPPFGRCYPHCPVAFSVVDELLPSRLPLPARDWGNVSEESANSNFYYLVGGGGEGTIFVLAVVIFVLFLVLAVVSGVGEYPLLAVVILTVLIA